MHATRRSAQPQAWVSAEPAPRFRVAVELSIGGDLRYLSHHDELRMLARAVVRARWPVAYSQGYNPLPRIVLPLPRSVGTASACQWALIDLDEPRSPAGLCQTLAGALPLGCTLCRVIAPAPRATPHARRATYQVELAPAEGGQLEGQIGELLAASEIRVMRRPGPDRPARAINIRPYIENIVWDGQGLCMCLVYEAQRSARPSEILTALGLAGDRYNHRVRRTKVEWDIELTGPTQRPAAPERKRLGKEQEDDHPSGKEDTQEEPS
jgi:radical SAM-linked protein